MRFVTLSPWVKIDLLLTTCREVSLYNNGSKTEYKRRKKKDRGKQEETRVSFYDSEKNVIGTHFNCQLRDMTREGFWFWDGEWYS